jgi:hypothetical protein
MSYRDATYVIFDGDNDKWAYAYLKGWNTNEYVDFDFRDAHDIDTMTASAQNEQYIKSKLRPRMKSSSAVVVLIGENTKWLYKYVRWELELALELGLPVIAVSLADATQIDLNLMPPIIRDKCIVQVPFKKKAIKHALDNWPMEYRSFSPSQIAEGPRHYTQQVYSSLGL